MADEVKDNVLLFGAGSVGAIYLYLLSRMCSTTAVCRSTYDIVKANGFVLHSEAFGKNLQFRPNVVRTCAEAAQGNRPFDYLLVCSKAIPGTNPPLIKDAVTPGHTVIVLLQNGINFEEEFAVAFPSNPIVTASVYCDTVQRPAGVVVHGIVQRLEIGAYPSSASQLPAQSFTKLMQAAGAMAEFYEDVQWNRWHKLLVNASWNAICALTLCTDVEFLEASPMAKDFARDVMLEVRDVALAYDYSMTIQKVDVALSRALERVPGGEGVEPSMLQDIKSGRKIEVEAIVGNTIRAGKEKGVIVPKLEVLYVLLKGLDSRMGPRLT